MSSCVPIPGSWFDNSAGRRSNQTVNVRFFDELNPTVAYVIGFSWACGGVKTRHRHVLRLSCDQDRRNTLTRVLSLMGSRHQIQDQYGNIAIADICNSHLVKQLLQNFGQPPGRANPDPSLPDMPVEFVPHFARGHLDATGRETQTSIRWTGTPRVIEELTEYMQKAANAGPSIRHRIYGNVNVAWSGRECVQRIQDWLNPGQGGITADPR